jgi:adenine-specific DNA-methyltransferase
MMAHSQQRLFANEPISYPKMPQVQFLGNKEKLLTWLFSFVPTSSLNRPLKFLDAFSGSGVVAYEAKRRNFSVTTNDILQYCWSITHSLVQNSSDTLNPEDITLLFHNTSTTNNLMQQLFTDVFFEQTETELLDQFRANVELLPLFKRSLALTVMNRALTRKVIMGHFAHLQAINYANDPIRIKRNPSIAKPIQLLFMELLPEFNQAVFDNALSHQSYNQDILELLATQNNFDVAYFDPPYCMSHSDYQAFYHLPETFCRYWTDKQFTGGTRRYFPTLPSGFDKKTTIIQSFLTLFHLSRNIPLWLISYNDRSYPSVQEFEQLLLKTKRNVTMQRNQYFNSRGGKGSVKGSHEILFIATL